MLKTWQCDALIGLFTAVCRVLWFFQNFGGGADVGRFRVRLGDPSVASAPARALPATVLATLVTTEPSATADASLGRQAV